MPSNARRICSSSRYLCPRYLRCTSYDKEPRESKRKCAPPSEHDESPGGIIARCRLVVIAVSAITEHIHAACHINFLFLFFLILFCLGLLSRRTVPACSSTTATTTASATCGSNSKTKCKRE